MILLALLLVAAVVQMLAIIRRGASPETCVPLAMTLLALVTNGWWCRSARAAYPAAPLSRGTAKARRATWLVAGASVVLAIWPRYTRLDQGLTADEMVKVETGILGHWETQADGQRHFHPITWQETLHAREAWTDTFKVGPWGYLEARAGHVLLGGSSDGTEPARERGLRLFPFASGILTVGLIALLSTLIAGPRAGLAAGLILALHPGHVMVSTTIGASSTMLLCFAAAILSLMKALETNRWPWWLALAAAQAACFLCNGASLGALVGLNAGGVAAILASRAGDDRLSHLLRLLLPVALGVVWLVTMDSFEYSSQWPDNALRDQWSQVVGGIPDTESGSGFSLTHIARDTPWRGVSARWFLLLCAGAGLLVMLFQDWRSRAVAACVLTGYFLCPESVTILFLALLLPPVLACAGAGLARLSPRNKRLGHAPVFIGVVYALTTLPVLHRLMALPALPIREVAAAAKRTGADAKAMTASPDASAVFYDPEVRVVRTLTELNDVVDAANEQGRSLRVYHRMAEGGEERRSLLEELEKSGRFQLVQEFTALELQNHCRLYRYQPKERIIHLNLKAEKKPVP
jgi:hypothetical protein